MLPAEEPVTRDTITYYVQENTNRIVERTTTEGKHHHRDRIFAVVAPVGYDRNLLSQLIEPDSIVIDVKMVEIDKEEEGARPKRKRYNLRGRRGGKRAKKRNTRSTTEDDSSERVYVVPDLDKDVLVTYDGSLLGKYGENDICANDSDSHKKSKEAATNKPEEDNVSTEGEDNNPDNSEEEDSSKATIKKITAMLAIARRAGVRLETLPEDCIREIGNHPLLQPGRLRNGTPIFYSNYRQIIERIVNEHRLRTTNANEPPNPNSTHQNDGNESTTPAAGNDPGNNQEQDSNIPDDTNVARMPPIRGMELDEGENQVVGKVTQKATRSPQRSLTRVDESKNEENRIEEIQRATGSRQGNVEAWRDTINNLRTDVMGHYDKVLSGIDEWQQGYERRIQELEEENESIKAKLKDSENKKNTKFERKLLSCRVRRFKKQADAEREMKELLEGRLKESEQYIKLLYKHLNKLGYRFPEHIEYEYWTLPFGDESPEDTDDEDEDDNDDNEDDNDDKNKAKKGKPKDPRNYD